MTGDRYEPRHEQVGRGHAHPRHRPVEHVRPRPTPYTAATSDLAVNYSNAGTWEHLADPYDDESPAGAVDQDNGMPWIDDPRHCQFASARRSTSPSPSYPQPRADRPSISHVVIPESLESFRHHHALRPIDNEGAKRGRRRAHHHAQGEQDLSDGRTEAQYEADFATMIGHYRARSLCHHSDLHLPAWQRSHGISWNRR